jgi:hypothetical protein
MIDDDDDDSGVIDGMINRQRKPAQCLSVHHKFHMTWSGLELGYGSGKPATDSLSYGTNFSRREFIYELKGLKSGNS